VPDDSTLEEFADACRYIRQVNRTCVSRNESYVCLEMAARRANFFQLLLISEKAQLLLLPASANL